MLRFCDVFFNGELRCFDDEVHASVDTHCKIMWEEMSGEALAKDFGKVVGEDAPESRWDSNRSKGLWIGDILVQAKKVGVGEVGLH